MKSDLIIEDVDELESLYMQCRSVFPAIPVGLIGHSHFVTGDFYSKKGFTAEIHLKEAITPEFIERNRRLGKWVNENAIIRLFGVMAHHKFIGNEIKIDQSLPGWQAVDLMRRMRNAFTKTQLNYRPNDTDNIKLRNSVIAYFGLNQQDCPKDEIPTPIDLVVQPIFKGCREYIVAKCGA